MTSQPLQGGNYIQYMCDIISPMFLTKYPLSMTSQPSVLMSPHSAYVWHPLHCRWPRIHSITPNNSIYDVTSTSGMTSHALYQTLHPLYLCHHNLSTDITPSFKWHHTHLLCDIIWLYRTSHPILMSSHYCTYDIKTSIYEKTSST